MKALVIAVSAAALILPGAAMARDLTGTWRLAVAAGDMTFNIDCAMTQQGSALSGTCTPVGVDGAQPSRFTGRVKESTAIWAYDVAGDETPIHLDYAASIRSDTTMVGAIIQGGNSVTFTAAKAAPGAAAPSDAVATAVP